MAQARAHSKYVKISPRKARLVADLIRGRKAHEASNILAFSNKKAGALLAKTLKSAVASAELEHGARPERLRVDEVRIDEGPTAKRSKSKCRGSSTPILKRSSHFTIVVSTEEDS